MFKFKKHRSRIFFLGVMLAFFSPTLSTPPYDTTAALLKSGRAHDAESIEFDEDDLPRLIRDVDTKGNDISITTISTTVLQPNVTCSLDVGQGILVPLVPVMDPTSKTPITQLSPLEANIVPVAIESVSGSTDQPDPEVSRRSMTEDDMDVAEDIVFRPLFIYRQETQTRQKYYRPYIYAYRKTNYNNYRSDYDG